MNYDLIIIGSGPAGLTSAVYAARYKLNILVIGQLPGGLAGEAHEVCNFPSYGKVGGMELMMKMIKQVQDFKVQIKNEEVQDLKKEKDSFEVKTNKETYSAKKIIIATGSERRKLGIKREKELTGKGISYCATCDSGFYKDKVAGVIGGSDAALTAALLLAKFAKKVYIIYRKDKFFRAEPTWIEEVSKTKNIEPIFDAEVEELIGEKGLEKVKLKDGKEIALDGLFIEVGSVPNIQLAEKLKLKLDKGHIAVDKEQKTNTEGVFAAGDITNNPLKQIVTACAEGAIASQTAYQEIQGSK
jgi:thioredoxin reductase (NADPH)